MFVSGKYFQAGLIFEGTTKSVCVKTIKHFSSSLKLLQNKLVCLSLASISRLF